MRGTRLLPGHQLELLHRGAEFFAALVAEMDRAQHDVRLETYIFHFDPVGQRVADALVRAAARGVHVSLVMDGIGTPEVPAAWRERFAAAGVRWVRFSPLGRWGLLIPGRWRRLHRKLCVVDAQVAFCGGINILDDHFQFHHGRQRTPRFDFAVRVRGPLVQDVHAAMQQFWRRVELTHDLEHLQWQELGRWLRSEAAPALAKAALPGSEAPATPVDVPLLGTPVQGADAALVLRDNLLNRRRIERAYLLAIGQASEDVVIANAYFLPGRKIRRALALAVARGVRVRVLVQGRYEYFMQYHAAKPAFAELLRAGVEIHEYRAGFFHAKVAVVDGQWATVGSSNLDPLSLLLAREANVVVDNAPFAQALLRSLDHAMAHDSHRLDAHTLQSRPWLQKTKDWLAYGLMRLSLFLTGRRY